MADILHRIHVRATPSEVFDALLHHRPVPGFGFALLRADRGSRIAWRCVDGPVDWVGTEISFDLLGDAHGTFVRFAHRHWRTPTDAMAEHATRWAQLLFQLKSWVETPEPEDLLAG